MTKRHRCDQCIDCFQLPTPFSQINLKFGGYISICRIKRKARKERLELSPNSSVVNRSGQQTYAEHHFGDNRYTSCKLCALFNLAENLSSEFMPNGYKWR